MTKFLKDKFLDYSKSKSFNSLFTFTHEHNDQFLLISVKNIIIQDNSVGYIAVVEMANDIKFAINERKLCSPYCNNHSFSYFNIFLRFK